ncbi:MAG: phosphocarrier protein HPr [Alphaproteobacteria bacterium]|jgi:phosphocarrier protein|nr:phosphocarrier protein HPr [Alphaproteobacteria bacterium]
MSNEPNSGSGNPAAEGAQGGSVVRVVRICNQKGLHARAAAKFVQAAEKFDAEVRVTRGDKGGCGGGEPCDGTSILDLLMLAAGHGTEITIEATGPQATEAIETLAALVAGRFTEGE